MACLRALLFIVSGVTLANESIDSVWNAYYHRQYDQVKRYVETQDDVNAHLLGVTFKIVNKEEDAEEALNQLLKQHANVAFVHHKAVKMWLAIGRQASVFSRMRYYERSVAAQIRAAELAPEQDRYRKDMARAKGFNGSLFSVDLEKQRAVVDTLKQRDPRYWLMAEMDYAQNRRDKKMAMQWIEQARMQFNQDIDVLERAAQLLWTNDDVEGAQQLFSQVCQLPPGQEEAWELWLQSCEISAMFAQNGEASLDIGLASSQRLINLDTVHDEYYADSLLVHAELLQKAGRKAEAIAALTQLTQLPASEETREKATRWLKKWEK